MKCIWDIPGQNTQTRHLVNLWSIDAKKGEMATRMLWTSAVVLLFWALTVGTAGTQGSLYEVPENGALARDRRTRARSAKDGKYISWREHRIDDEGISKVRLRGGDGLEVTDLDNDGNIDVVSVHEDSSHIRIAFGTQDPDRWDNFTLASGEAVKACEDVAVGDINGDGRMDIVVACEVGNLTYFQAAEKPRDISAWKATVLAATLGRGSWIRVKIADVNGDGKLDIVGVNKGRFRPPTPGTFSCFYVHGEPTDSDAWKETVIGRASFPAINARPIDLDQDGDLDIVGGSWGEGSIYVFENTAEGVHWRKHPVHSGPQPVAIGFMMEFTDVDGDGRIDIISGSGPRSDRDQIHWFQHPGKLGQNWKPYFLGSVHPDRATGLRLTDINDDARLDLVVGGYSWGLREREPRNPKLEDSCGRLAWFEMPREPMKEWIRHDVSRRRRGMFDAFVVRDVNGDGLLDLITTRGNSGEYDGVIWLEQVRTHKPVPAFKQARTHDSSEIPIAESNQD